MKKSIFGFAVLSFLLFSCEKKTETIISTSGNQDTLTVVNNDTTLPNDDSGLKIDEHNSRLSLDWNGTYHGTLPCADCEGIHTIVELHQDETFKLTQEYLNKNTKSEETGTFKWSADGGKIKIKTKDNGEFNFIVGEDRLIILDQEGEKIAGNLAEHYILKKK
ncbi:copper resistance protein NlpE [Faecalibacter sp. LW9]|uniref:copper resistance protein NlpE n=1 Tax=Faecalibacter sp. LW9 TaxID=3103144 RepID=UPI002AFEBDB5|nr:copper resistance protein NlpE [Faecalibacter sp. LW9]